MKKSIMLLFAVAMLFSLVACGSSSTEAKSDDQTTQQSSIDKEPVKPESDSETKSNFVIDNEVIVDNEYCTVTLVNATAKKSGVDFKFSLENKTTDKNIMFSMDDTAVNGWLISSLFAESVAAGKKATETLSFSNSDLEDCGLTSIDKLEFYLRVYDNDDWMADEFVEDTFTVYPTGLTDVEVVSPDRWIGKDEMTVVDDANCSFIILGTYEDSVWGYTVAVYLENKTADQSMVFSWDDVSVNGYMIDPFWGASVSPGNKRISTISFSSSEFDENNIESVDEIEFELRVYNDEDWYADDYVKDVFTYKPVQ